MGFEQQFKKTNRRQNAGGVFPDAQRNMLALANVFVKIKSSGNWWCGFIYGLKVQSNQSHQQMIFRIWYVSKVLKDCRPHALRIYGDGRQSWVEYSLAYPVKSGTTWLWQPVPTKLNLLFLDVLQHVGYDTPLLNKREKLALFARITRKQKRTMTLARATIAPPRTLFNYFTQCIQADPNLSTLSKSVLLPQTNNIINPHVIISEKIVSNSDFKSSMPMSSI